MADNTEKFTAEALKDLEASLKSAGVAQENARKILAQYKNSLKEIVQEYGSFSAAQAVVKKGAEKTAESFSNLKEKAENAGETLQKAIGSFQANKDKLKEFGLEAVKTIAVYQGLSKLPAIKGFDQFKQGADVANETNSSFTELRETLSKVGIDIPLADELSYFYAAKDQVNQLESSLISAKVATGEYGGFLSDLENNVTSLSAELEAIDENFLNVANSSGVTLEAARKFGSVMNSQLPSAIQKANGAFEDNTNVMVDNETSMNRLEATFKVAMGAGLQMSDVQDIQDKSFQRFNSTVQQSLENISKMSVTAQNLNLPIKNITSIVSETSDAFLFFGDNTQSLLDTMARLGPAFKAAGLSPEAITRLSTTMVQNINGMSLAQRSFLAMQAGASAGLKGGYQIELLKTQNKFDEIQKMTEKALKKQFGGKVVTLEEAAKDEGAARQLAKQVQLVTSGPTKVVDTEAQAYKLFEAMRSGAAGAPQISGMEALDKTVTTGNSVAEKQTNELVKLNNFAQHTSMSTAITAAAMVKQVDLFAKKQVESGATREIFDKMGVGSLFDSLFPSNELASLKAATESAAGTGPAFRQGPPKLTPEEKIGESIRKGRYAIGENPLKAGTEKANEKSVSIEEAAKSPEAAAEYAKSAAKKGVTSTVQERTGPVLPSVPVPDNKKLDATIKNYIDQKALEGKTAGGQSQEQTLTFVLQYPDGTKQAEALVKLKDGILQEVQRKESAKNSRNQAGTALA